MYTKKVSIVLVLLGLTTCVFGQDKQSPKVKTPLGSVLGYYKISEGGRTYEAFEGIPYALPPIGKLRFKPPHPILSWQGELPATKFSSPCLQYQHVYEGDRVTGSEDCLYLNIYRPARDASTDKKKLPVFVWIHGGAFQFGTGSDKGPRFIMDRDLIFVNFNYRLGPFGFLSTEDEVVPGNMGLKDQNMALRWVSENIEWFGGDPKKITIGGLSAGGASVHYHYLSPLSTGLFRAGISFSGTSFDCWTQSENALEKTKKLANILGCPTTTHKEMIRCMRYRPSRVISQATSEFMPWLYNPYTPFGPVVEKVGDSPFIDRPPVEIVNSGDVQDVPWITSVVSEEGLYPAAEFVTHEKYMKELDENWTKIAPYLLDFNFTLPQDQHAVIAKKIRERYLGSKKIDANSAHDLIKMVGDRLFVVDSVKAAKMQAKVNKSPVWYYYYTYQATGSLTNVYTRDRTQLGVSHGDDALRMFENGFFEPAFNDEEREMQKELIDLVVSFVTDGAPKIPIEWKKVDPSKKELDYLLIYGPGKYKMETDASFGQKTFWDSIGFNENKLPQTSRTTKDEF